MSGRRIIIGTAGHIDHGKSTLVRALTGIDPDRLPEEQARGMTIDLGFAFWEQGIAFIDVPGHERFIKNMVAGATGIDAALLVIAADDGIMPQTIEHHTILNLLGVSRGVVAITKSEGKDPDWLSLIKDDVASLLATGTLANSPIIAVDSLSGMGIAELVTTLRNLVSNVPERGTDAPALLSIDRVFVKTGFGVVVTGTVVSGTIRVGDELQLLPQKTMVRIRGIQSQNESRNEVGAGERAALNLAGIDKETIVRGNRLCAAGVYTATNAFDVLLTACGEQPIKHRARIRMHLGTAEVIGRIDLLEGSSLGRGEPAGYARFQSEEPIVGGFGERFVIRRYSPLETVGGGIVLNPMPLKRLRNEDTKPRLERLRRSDILEQLEAAVSEAEPNAAPVARLAIALSLSPNRIESLCTHAEMNKKIFSRSGSVVTCGFFEREKAALKRTLHLFHKANPERIGAPAVSIIEPLQTRLGNGLTDLLLTTMQTSNDIVIDRNMIRLRSHEAKVNDKENERLNRFIDALRQHGLTPPIPGTLATEINLPEKELYRFADLLRERDELVVLEGRYWLLRELYEPALQSLTGHLQSHETIALSEAAALWGISRRYAVALIEEMDKRGITERIGDTRRLKKPK